MGLEYVQQVCWKEGGMGGECVGAKIIPHVLCLTVLVVLRVISLRWLVSSPEVISRPHVNSGLPPIFNFYFADE